MSMFMASDATPQRTLADIIMERIHEAGVSGDATANMEGGGRSIPGIDKKVIEVYQGFVLCSLSICLSVSYKGVEWTLLPLEDSWSSGLAVLCFCLLVLLACFSPMAVITLFSLDLTIPLIACCLVFTRVVTSCFCYMA
jgi:hypothetical protein